MPLTIGRSRRSGLAKTVVKTPRKQVIGQPGLEPIDAPLTPLEKKVARTFVEALTLTQKQITDLLEDDNTNGGPLTPFFEYLEPARKELSDALLEQLDDTGAFFWNQLVEQLKRKPDPSAVNFVAKSVIRKDIDPEDVTVVMPTGAEFSTTFSKRTPRGRRWADNESARLITNIAEETRENLQDVIASATGRGGRQRMMTLLGNVLENAPAGIDSGSVITKFQSEVSPAVAGLTFKQHNAVINTANKAFDDALAKGLPFNKAVNAAEKEALAHGKRAREYRARMISRTEMMEASNRGKLEAAQQAAEAGMFNAQRAGRQWVTSSFDVCPTCEPLHGKIVAFEGGSFYPKHRSQGSWVEEPRDLPPAHPNCRCTWTLVYDVAVPSGSGPEGLITPPPDIPQAVLNRAWEAAGKMRKNILSNSPAIQQDIVGVAGDIDAQLRDMSLSMKGDGALAREIADNYMEQQNLELVFDSTTIVKVEDVADNVSDALIYTFEIPDDRYIDDVQRALRDFSERGYKFDQEPKNYWRILDEREPYNGIDVNLIAPNGTKIEVQFHTPSSYRAKETMKPLLERQRAAGVSPTTFDEIQTELTKIAQDVTSPLREVVDTEPFGVTDLRYFPDEEVPFRIQTEDDLYNRFGGRLPDGSMDAYTNEAGEWWEGRERLHNKIVEKELAKATPVEEPIVHFMGGGPASGKGTAIREGLIDVPDNIVVVDADEIKGALPEYVTMVEEKTTSAAAYVHEESSMLSKRMFQESVDTGRHTQLDGTGDSSMEKLRSKVAGAREAQSARGGKKVIADYMTIDTEEAVARAAGRGRRTGRYVPEEVVRDTHASISRIFPDILDENLFDDVKLWDTAFEPPKLILRKVDGVLEIYDEAAYERFLLKNPDYQGAGIQAGVEPIIDSKSRVYLTIDEQYDPLRQKQVHEPFYEKQLAQGVATDEPDVVFLGGGPASGKSSIIDTGDVELPEGHVLVNADDAKEAIPEYNVIVENGDDWASTYTHEESSDMAKELMARSIRDESMPTVLDGTGDSSFASLSRKVETAREQAKGGRVIGEYVTVDTDVALQRTVDRYKRTGRKVPKEVVEGTHQSVSKVFPEAAEADLFDELRLWDTNSGKPVLIYEKVDGVEDIIDQELYERFLRKNPDYVPPAPAPVSTPVKSVRHAANYENEPTEMLDGVAKAASKNPEQERWIKGAENKIDEAEGILERFRLIPNAERSPSSKQDVREVLVDAKRQRKYGVSVDAVGGKRGHLPLLDDIREAQGFTGKGALLSADEANRLIDDGGTQMFRGDFTPNASFQLQQGEYYVGAGIYGNGTYMSGTGSAVFPYAVKGAYASEPTKDFVRSFGGVQRIIIDPDAKVIDIDEAVRLHYVNKRSLETLTDTVNEEWNLREELGETTFAEGDGVLSKASLKERIDEIDISAQSFDSREELRLQQVVIESATDKYPTNESFDTTVSVFESLGYDPDDPFKYKKFLKKKIDEAESLEDVLVELKQLTLIAGDTGSLTTSLGYDVIRVDTRHVRAGRRGGVDFAVGNNRTALGFQQDLIVDTEQVRAKLPKRIIEEIDDVLDSTVRVGGVSEKLDKAMEDYFSLPIAGSGRL